MLKLLTNLFPKIVVVLVLAWVFTSGLTSVYTRPFHPDEIIWIQYTFISKENFDAYNTIETLAQIPLQSNVFISSLISSIAQVRQQDPHQGPLYCALLYIIGKVSRHVFFPYEARLFSLCTYTMLLGMIYSFVLRYYRSTCTALFALLIAATNNFWDYHSIMARYYSLYGLIWICVLWSYLHAIETNKRISWITFGVAFGALVNTFPLAIAQIFIFALLYRISFAFYKNGYGNFFVASLITILLHAPYIINAYMQRHNTLKMMSWINVDINVFEYWRYLAIRYAQLYVDTQPLLAHQPMNGHGKLLAILIGTVVLLSPLLIFLLYRKDRIIQLLACSSYTLLIGTLIYDQIYPTRLASILRYNMPFIIGNILLLTYCIMRTTNSIWTKILSILPRMRYFKVCFKF